MFEEFDLKKCQRMLGSKSFRVQQHKIGKGYLPWEVIIYIS